MRRRLLPRERVNDTFLMHVEAPQAFGFAFSCQEKQPFFVLADCDARASSNRGEVRRKGDDDRGLHTTPTLAFLYLGLLLTTVRLTTVRHLCNGSLCPLGSRKSDPSHGPIIEVPYSVHCPHRRQMSLRAVTLTLRW